MLVGLLFVAAGTIKVTRRREFADELDAYRILPSSLLPATAAVLPAVEIAAGALVWVPATRTAASAALATMLVVFAVATSVVLARGERDVSCACLGRASHAISWALPVRNAVLALVALAGAGSSAPAGDVALSAWVATGLVALVGLVVLELIEMLNRVQREVAA